MLAFPSSIPRPMPLSPADNAIETSATAGGAGPLTAAALHEAALDYLACYAASTARLRRVLERRVRRRRPDRDGIEAARKTIAEVIAKLTAQGYLGDERYAAARVESLVRQGRSRRWIEARLAADGIAPALIRAAVEGLAQAGAETELAAAIAFAKRRRLGPFRIRKRRSDDDPKAQAGKEMAALARAGFDRRTARTVLEAPSAEALASLLATTRG
jgi:regulatory protein